MEKVIPMLEPVRVLLIVPRYGSLHRGVEVFARELSQSLDKNRFHVTILSGTHGLREQGVETVEMPLLERESLPSWAWALLRHLPGRMLVGPAELEALTLMLRSRTFLRERTFDVILPFGGTWTYRFAKRYSRGARIISVGHAGPVVADLKLSNSFVALTPSDEALAHKMLPSLPITVIPNGVDVERFRPAAPPHRDMAGKTILCVGAYTPDKRHDLLFDAALRLDASIRIVCAGQGPLKSSLMQHPLYRQGRVDFVEKEHEEMPALYQAADAFTLASPGEAFGLVFLEALACGLPVVAHDAPRQRFVVGETGFFCDVLDPNAYARALNQALLVPTDPKRIRHAKQFSWGTVAAQYQELFSDLSWHNLINPAFME